MGIGSPAFSLSAYLAEKDRQALQQTLQSTFAKGRNQDMGIGGSKEAGSYGLRPGKPPSEAAKKILEAAGNKFASAGKLELAESSAGGLVMKKDKKPASPPKTVRT